MSNSRLFDLYDPKHGKVGELCKTLGYASERKGPPRSLHFLSSKVSTFRKDFLDTTAGLDLFPLEYQSMEAQLCASKFLTSKSHLFGHSEEALAFNWPIYPRDNEKLIENLAKLMCTQEYFHRRNANYAQSMQQKVYRYPGLFSRTSLISAKKALEDNEDSTPDESDSEHSEVVERSSSPASSVDSTQEERSAINHEKVRENIEIHLNFMYPLDGNDESKSSHWLFNSERWPNDTKRFAFRYLHEHNLYSKRKANFGAVALFAAKLKCHLDVECNEAGDVLVQRRCGRQIAYLAGVWRVYGFLEETDGALRKTEEFEAAWRDRRKQWIDLVHNGDPSGAIELGTSLFNAAENVAGSKRVHVHKEPVYDLPSHNAPAGSAAKRPRVEGFENTSSGSRTASEGDHSFDTGHRRHETISLEAEMIREPRRAPEAPIFTPVAAGPQRSANAVEVEHEQNDNTAGQSSRCAKKSPNMNQARLSLQPDCPSARSRATLDESLDMSSPLEKRSSPYALSGSSLNLPFNADTALVRSKQTAPPGKPQKPKLYYILPSSRGGLDHDDPLPRETFWGCNISEFFRVVATRAGKTDESLTCLTFTYNWGERETFVVNRCKGDQYWEEIKERVKGTFLKTRNSMKKRTRFELWVEFGDTTNLDEVEEEDDNW